MKNILSAMLGLLFGTGLCISGMYSPDIILSGLKIGAASFCLDLYATFSSALLVTAAFYSLRKWISKPLCDNHYDLTSSQHIDKQLIVGSGLFGIGWGVSGLCPGPNIVGLGLWPWPFYWWSFIGIMLGYIIADFYLYYSKGRRNTIG